MNLVLNNLTKESERIRKATDRGVTLAALFIKGEAQALTPIRLGNLVNSAYVVSTGMLRPQGGGKFVGPSSASLAASHGAEIQSSSAKVRALGIWKPAAICGYSAPYSYSVHENPLSGGGKAALDPAAGEADDIARATPNIPLAGIHSKGGQWKFLEIALVKNIPTIKAIIRREAGRG